MHFDLIYVAIGAWKRRKCYDFCSPFVIHPLAMAMSLQSKLNTCSVASPYNSLPKNGSCLANHGL